MCLCLCLWLRWCSGRRLILLWGRVADVWLCASSRSPARPRHRPRAPQPGPPLPPAPSTLAAPGVLACGPARTRRHSRARQPGPATAHGRCSQARFEARPCPPVPPAPSTPAGPVVLVCPARPRRRTRAPQPGSLFSPAPSTPAVPVVLVCPARPRHRPRASPLMLTNFARNSPTTVSNLECASLELQRFQRLLKLPSNELRATFLEPAVSYVLHQRIQECSVFRGPTVPRGCAWFGHSWGVRTSL